MWFWTSLRRRGLCEKLLAHYTGPFVVLDRINDVNYLISRLPPNGRRYSKTQAVHVTGLKHFHFRDMP